MSEGIKKLENTNRQINKQINNQNNNHTKSNIKSNIKTNRIKKFDQKLYDKYDIPARDIVKKVLGDNVCDNPDIYNEDMILKIDNCRYKYLELQVCTQWTDDRYPYDAPYVYARKQKFSDDTLFLVFNRKMDVCLLFDKKSLKLKPRRLKKYSRYFVYETNWHRVMRVNIDHLDSETIKLYS